MSEASENDRLLHELQALREENARLRAALEEARLKEPEEVIRAIRQGEVDALVVGEEGQEHVYSLQTFGAVYRTVVEECFPYGVWLTEPDGALIYVSPSFLKVLGVELQQLQERGQFHFLPSPTRDEIEAKWKKCRECCEAFNVEYPVELPDGSTKTIWTHGLLVRTPDGMHRWVGVNIDVTEREQVRGELHQQAMALKETDRQKDEFLALLGHELRNPLAPIRNALHILLQPNVDQAVVGQLKGMMDKQINHLTRLVDDLLDVSRISRGKIELRKESVALAAAASNAIESVRPLIEARNHTLATSLPAEAVHIEADPTRLEQILVNLLNNAAKYTPRGGQISLTATIEDGQAVIRVCDNGVGMPPELLPKVFNLFAQAEASLDRSDGGLGIGLTLVKKLVNMHGGEVAAFSEGRDKGSEFVVRLPALADGAAETDSDQAEGAAGSAKLRVLVVDDSEDTAQTMKLFLEFAGHEVRAVYDGPSALVAYRTYHPDVVLLDVGLPGMNGYDVARQLRRELTIKCPMLVAVSGYGQEEDKQRAHDAGFDLHVTKPVDPRKLVSIIASASPQETA